MTWVSWPAEWRALVSWKRRHPRLERWLREGRHGEMGYMANNFDMRLDPRRIVDGA